MQKLLTLVIVLCAVGCGRHEQQQSLAASPSTPEKWETIEDKPAQSAPKLPEGWVKIVSRETGLTLGLGGNAPKGDRSKASRWRIERAGDAYRILNQNSGQYLGLSDWSKQNDGGTSHLADTPGASIFWTIEPAGKDVWRLINRDTGKCLESRRIDGRNVVRQSPADKPSKAQEWRLETGA